MSAEYCPCTLINAKTSREEKHPMALYNILNIKNDEEIQFAHILQHYYGP